MSLWKNLDKKLLLASTSPRRKLILEKMGFDFEVVIPEEFNESDFLNISDIEHSLQRLAVQKAKKIAFENPHTLVLGADTIVIDNETILGKPYNYQNAFNILKKLSGKSHKVMTGVALICNGLGFKKTGIATTDVIFRQISDEEINEYLLSNEYSDKAGAYGIQGKAMAFVDGIKGCFYNVVGLPVACTIRLFNEYVVRKEYTDA